jgi:hypothetical protein
MKREILVLIALGALGGCASSGLQVKKVAFMLPQGWTKAESDDKSVSLAVRPGFRYGANTIFGTSNPFEGNMASDPSKAQMSIEDKKAVEQMTNAMKEVNKEDERKNLDKLSKKGIILNCISTGKPVIGEELTRFYVKRKSQSAPWTWSDIDASEQDFFREKQKAKEVKLPLGVAHRMQASWQLIDGSNYTQISYLLPSGSNLYVLRLQKL